MSLGTPDRVGPDEDSGASCRGDQVARGAPNQARLDEGADAGCGGNQAAAGERTSALVVGVEAGFPIVMSDSSKEVGKLPPLL